MANPYLGEIHMFAGNFAIKNYAFCDGQLLSINDNQALFSLLGTTFGGDGNTTYGLPDMRGRIPVHQGTGEGLTERKRGQKFGNYQVTLNALQIPNHNHPMQASPSVATQGYPSGQVPASGVGSDKIYNAPPDPSNQTAFADDAVIATGNDQPHDNWMPYLAISFIIAMQGVYPPRN